MGQSTFGQGLLAALLCTVAFPALAQVSDRERAAELERQLAAQEAALKAQEAALKEQQSALVVLRAQIQALQGQLAPTPAGPISTTPVVPAGADVRQTQVDSTAAGANSAERPQQPAADYSIAPPRPGMPLATFGTSGLIEVGSKDRASLTLAIPIFGRTRYNFGADKGHRLGEQSSLNYCVINDCTLAPWVWTTTVQVSTPLKDGIGTLFDLQDRDDRGDLDYLSGTSVKLGIDFIRYRKREGGDGEASTRTGVKTLISDAIKACLTAQHNLRIESASAVAGDDTLCVEGRIAAWMFETKREDDSRHADLVYKRPDWVKRYNALLWRATDKEIPDWGAGFSTSYSNQDYTWMQGSVSEPVRGANGKFAIPFNPLVALGPEQSEDRSSWLVEAHAWKYFAFSKYSPINEPGRIIIPGLMILPQIQYRSEYAFRPGTAKYRCQDLSISTPTQTFSDCATIQIDRPYRNESITALVETRWQLERVPGIGSVGFSQRYGRRFGDGANTFEASIYFPTKDGSLSGGLRYRYTWGGEDVLGNDDKKVSQIMLFFQPLTFTGP